MRARWVDGVIDMVIPSSYQVGLYCVGILSFSFKLYNTDGLLALVEDRLETPNLTALPTMTDNDD